MVSQCFSLAILTSSAIDEYVVTYLDDSTEFIAGRSTDLLTPPVDPSTEQTNLEGGEKEAPSPFGFDLRIHGLFVRLCEVVRFVWLKIFSQFCQDFSFFTI